MHEESLPALFDRVGVFFVGLEELQKRWLRLTPEQRVEAIDDIFLPAGRSKVDKATNDFQAILDVIYEASSRGCTMKVQMR